jgi:hypothetical protein
MSNLLESRVGHSPIKARHYSARCQCTLFRSLRPTTSQVQGEQEFGIRWDGEYEALSRLVQHRFGLEGRVRSRRQLGLDLAANLRRRISRRRVGARLYRQNRGPTPDCDRQAAAGLPIQLDFGADPSAVRAIAEAERLTYGHLGGSGRFRGARMVPGKGLDTAINSAAFSLLR